MISLLLRPLLTVLCCCAFLTLAGCPKSPPGAPATAKAKTTSQPLMLIVVDDPDLGARVAREWHSRTEEQLTFRHVTQDELTSASRLAGDVIIFPSGLIGQLAERGLVLPLESPALEDADFAYRDIFPLIRQREMRWANRTVAAPLGSPQLLLCYRADIFEKLGLAPPTDWAEYQAAVERLANRESLGELSPPADQPWQAAIEPLAERCAGQVLLARAAAYALHRDQVSPLFRIDTLAPLIDQPPYVRALEELVAADKASGHQAHTRGSSPAEAFSKLHSGMAAMAITWPPASDAPDNQIRKVSFAPLPAGKQAYRFATESWEPRDDAEPLPLSAIAGRMAAVSSSTSDARRGSGFVLWLSNREVSQEIAPHSAATTLFRKSQVASSARWTPSLTPESSRQYAETLATVLSAPRAFPNLTLPGRADYLAALDKAVHEALEGKPPAEALAAAAMRWREITDKLGLENQRRANSRSLGQGEF